MGNEHEEDIFLEDGDWSVKWERTSDPDKLREKSVNLLSDVLDVLSAKVRTQGSELEEATVRTILDWANKRKIGIEAPGEAAEKALKEFVDEGFDDIDDAHRFQQDPHIYD